MKLTKKQAIDLSIIKWRYLAKTGKSDYYGSNEKIYKLNHECGLCEKYRVSSSSDKGDLTKDTCSKCPLFKKWGMSCGYGSLFNNWCGVEDNVTFSEEIEINERKRIANLILADIKSLT